MCQSKLFSLSLLNVYHLVIVNYHCSELILQTFYHKYLNDLIYQY